MFRFLKPRDRRRPGRSPQQAVASRSIDVLEDRRVLATFGIAWPEARSLSVSFPSDSASIGAYGNSIRHVFDQVAGRQEWQEAALRAFQTWAVYSNINVGLVPDRGDAFGTVGLGVNDPRFGEFRIGAFPQPGVNASALPFQQIAGTWSGDVLLNTQRHWFLADPKVSTVTVPQPNEKGPGYELFTVLLHEAGNALGVADTTRRGTVMFQNYDGPRRTLVSADISAIRAIYGARRDIYEAKANNSRTAATRIVAPPGYNGTTPLSVNGSLNTMSDIDFYRFSPVAGQEKVNVRLWAAGISLVKTTLEIQDRFGNKLADVKADSIFDNNLEIEVGSLKDHPELFIRVARNADDVFGIGDYRIELDYRDRSQQPSNTPPVYDADAVDEDDVPVPYVSLDALFANGLVTSERGTNDTLSTATVLESSPGWLVRSRYDVQSALSGSGDRDFFRLQAPASPGGVLNVDVSPIGTELLTLEVVVLNATGDRVPARLVEKSGGTKSVQIENPVPGGTYVVAVLPAAGSASTQGNYILTADFATDRNGLAPVFSGSVSNTVEDYSELETGKPQLFRFDLSAVSSSADEGVQLTIYDSRTAAIMFTLSVPAGQTSTEYIWLPRGRYALRATARARNGRVPGNINYSLAAAVISDDQGPNPVDPTQGPGGPDYDYNWVDTPPTSPPPVLNPPPPVMEDPWLSRLTLSIIEQYYQQFLQ
jgi:hypothetical protein